MADVRKIINAAESLRDRCILKLFAYTGIRRAELASLDVRDVELKEHRIHIREGKGAKARTVPITPEQSAAGARYLFVQWQGCSPDHSSTW